METGEIETSEIAVVDTENEDSLEVPVDDVEHEKIGTDSKISGIRKIKKSSEYSNI